MSPAWSMTWRPDLLRSSYRQPRFVPRKYHQTPHIDENSRFVGKPEVIQKRDSGKLASHFKPTQLPISNRALLCTPACTPTRQLLVNYVVLCSIAASGTFCIGIAKTRVIYEGI